SRECSRCGTPVERKKQCGSDERHEHDRRPGAKDPRRRGAVHASLPAELPQVIIDLQHRSAPAPGEHGLRLEGNTGKQWSRHEQNDERDQRIPAHDAPPAAMRYTRSTITTAMTYARWSEMRPR